MASPHVEQVAHLKRISGFLSRLSDQLFDANSMDRRSSGLIDEIRRVIVDSGVDINGKLDRAEFDPSKASEEITSISELVWRLEGHLQERGTRDAEIGRILGELRELGP